MTAQEPPAAPAPGRPKHSAYRPISARRRVLIVVLAIATAATVLLSLIYRPGGVQRTAPAPLPDAALCTAGQSLGCVGGKADVILPEPGAARPR